MLILVIIIIIIWGANRPYSQLELNCEGRGFNVFEKQACKGAFSSQPHQPIVITKHSQDRFFFLREDNRIIWNTLVAQQRTVAQLNSHMAPTGNRTGVTLVTGERFTHKPTVPYRL